MNNWEIATDATTTAMNSQGSAMKEQEKYSNSLQARINRLSNAWTELSLVAGEAIVTDSFIGVVESLKVVTQGVSFLVDKVGLLPGVFATAGVAVVALSAKFRGFATAMVLGTSGMTAAQFAATSLTAGMSRAAIAAAGLKVAFRGLLIATGVGAAFAIVGFAIEKLVSHFSNLREEEKKFQDQQNENIKAITTHKDQLDDLLVTYEAMEKRKENGNGWDVEQEKEFLNVQNQIAAIYPSLIDHVDATGQSHLKASSEIEKEIEATKALIELKKEETRLNAANDINKEIKSRDKIAKKIKETKDEIENWSEYKPIFGDSSQSDKEINKLKQKLVGLETDFANASQNINEKAVKITEAFNDIEIDPKISKEIESVINSMDLSELDGDEIDAFSQRIAGLAEKMQNAMSSGDNEAYERSSKSLSNYLKTMGATDTQIASFVTNFSDLKSATSQNTDATARAIPVYDELGNVIGQTTEVIEENIDAQQEQLSLSEQLIGLGDSDVARMKEKLAIYSALSQQEDLSVQQQAQLRAAYEELSAIFPHLAEGGKLHIDNMEKQIEQQDMLVIAIEKMAQGQLSAEEQMTVNAAIGAKNRISILNKMLNAYKKASEHLQAMASEAANNGYDRSRDEMAAWRFGSAAADMESNMLKDITFDLDQYIQSLADITDYNGKNYKSQENWNKELEKSKYVSDKYKLKLEAINTQLAQLNAAKSKYPSHSRQYRDALTKEIKLLKEQAGLYASQQKDLKGQIKSGNFKQYGNVTTTSSSSGSSSGSYGGKYASYVNEAAKKYGVDPFLIAAIIQQESNFNPNARSHAGAQGLMQLMPGTARGLGVKNSYDPYQNIMGGTKYIAQQLKSFGGDLTKALAAYNAGPGNVRKYGGVPPFKETQNYVKKVTDSFKSMAGTVSTVSSAVSTASKSVADYYLNNFRKTSDFLEHRSTGQHKGVDFANGRQGDPVKAIKGGKVITAAYSKTAGYWVIIQQDDGKVAKYMHLQKGLNVKAGQTVSSGAQLGKVGNTGRSSGAHLHLQIESGGKPIDPMAYLKTIQSSSSAVASGTEALDNAQMELLQSQQSAAQVSQQIQALYFELVNSRLAEFQRERDLLNDNVAIYERGMTIYVKGSRDWLTMQSKRQSVLGKQMSMQADEIKFIKEHIKWNEHLSAEQKAQLVDNLTAANEAYYQTRIEFQELQMEVINTMAETYQRERQLLEDNLAVYERGMSVYRLGSAEWLKMQAQKNSMMGKQMVLYTKEIEYIKKQMATNKSLTKQQRADLQDMLTETTQAYYQMRVQFQELQMEKINAVVERYSREQQLLTDNLAIAQYVAGKEKELSDEWIKSMQDRKDITKQQMEYQWTTVKYLQGQLKTNKSITKEQRQQIEIMLGDAKTAYYSLRDQYDSLNEEFISAQTSLADEIVDLYKKAYEQQRDAQLAALDDEQEAFEKNHDDKMKMLDKELTKYEEIINKKLESLREEKETDDFNKGLTDRQTEIGELTSKRDALAMDDSREGKARLAEIEKELKEKQEELADYLADRELQQREKSLTDMLEDKQKEVELEREALDEKLESQQESFDKERERINKHYDNLLNDEKAFQTIREQVMIGSFTGLSAELMKFAHITRDNMKYIGDSVANTFIDSISKVRNQLKDLQGEFKQKATVQKETGLFHGTKEDNLKFTRMLNKGESYSITGYSDMNGGMYRLGHASSNLWVKAKDVGLEFLGFSSGGYTGNGEGLAMLHEKEIVLNKSDTKNMLEMVKMIRPMANLIKTPVLPKFNLPSIPKPGLGDLNLTIQNMTVTGDKNGVKQFFKEIENTFSKNGVSLRV